MRFPRPLLAVLALGPFAPRAAAANTWHVDASATPPGLGTAGSPWASLSYAVVQPAVQNGDTFLVAPGSYSPPASAPPYLFLTGLTIRSTHGPTVTRITGPTHVPTASALEGFTVEGQVDLAYGDTVLRRSLVVCPSGDCSAAGERAVFADDGSSVEGCVLSGYHTGIQMFGFATVTVVARNTVFHDVERVAATWATLHLDHCAIEAFTVQGNVTQTGTVLGDPASWVWDAAHGDFHLRPGSACVDAGAGLDPDGSPADIGAFVYDAAYASPPTAYCEGLTTSDGCLASVGTVGACSASSGAPFVVHAAGVPPDKTGRLLYSLGEASAPFQGGTLCLALPLTRTPATSSGSQPPPFEACSGVLERDFNAWIRESGDPRLVPGAIVYAQYRFRDPFAASGEGVGWSNAVRFGIAP